MKNETRFGSIYVLTCMITGEQYVGKALKTTAEKRWDQHIASALVKESTCLIHKAIRKYGVENFTAEVVQRCAADKLNAAEKCWVKKLGTLVPGGYNLTIGGEGSYGFRHKPKSKRKMAVAALEVWTRDGHRELMREVHLGQVVTPAHRARISSTLKGHSVTAETRAKIVSAQKGRPLKPAHVVALTATWHNRALVSEAARAAMSAAQTKRRKRERRSGC